ncbi:MAG: nucleic acid-binding protein [Blastocatellia bacterium]
MSAVFVDTAWWVASVNVKDQWHAKTLELEPLLDGIGLVTTDAVLTEMMNYFSAFGEIMRVRAVSVVDRILNHPEVAIVWQTPALFMAACELYEARPDKGYSLTGCFSMIVMREQKMSDILTNDHHFTQEGFNILLR